jgi:hypothetical protein
MITVKDLIKMLLDNPLDAEVVIDLSTAKTPLANQKKISRVVTTISQTKVYIEVK